MSCTVYVNHCIIALSPLVLPVASLTTPLPHTHTQNSIPKMSLFCFLIKEVRPATRLEIPDSDTCFVIKVGHLMSMLHGQHLIVARPIPNSMGMDGPMLFCMGLVTMMLSITKL